MNVVQDFAVRPLADCRPGELVRFYDDDHLQLAILCEAQPPNAYLAVILSSTDANLPTPLLRSITARHGCATFGVDWILELDDSDTAAPGNPEGVDTQGAIRLDANRLRLNIGGTNGRSNLPLSYFDLGTLTPDDRERRSGAPILAWKIWASDDHRFQDRASPIHSWSAAARQA